VLIATLFAVVATTTEATQAIDLPVAPKKTAISGTIGQASRFPSVVLIIRHAEKPDDEGDPHLNSRGAARAAALPSLFSVKPPFRTMPAPFPTPDFIFATRESDSSNRPVETVTPLSQALGELHIRSKHKDNDFQAAVDDIFGDGKLAGKTVLICWHHGKIPELAKAILNKASNATQVEAKVPDRWKGTVFDRVFKITFDDRGTATFEDRPQRLLFGDNPT
jgi:hypothetical protein